MPLMKKRYGFIYVDKQDDGTGDYSRKKKKALGIKFITD